MSAARTTARLQFGWGTYHFFRAMERLFPPAILRAFFWPVAAGLAGWELARPSFQSPAIPLLAASTARRWQGRTAFHLCRLLSFAPDRFSAPQWRRRCEMTGFQQVEAALSRQRPVILATLHFGPLFLARYWLRAAGLPASTLVSQPAVLRNPIRRRKDELSDGQTGLHPVPHVFSREELAHARRSLGHPVVLMMAVDFQAGKTVDVPLGEEVFRMATGAIRLAERTGALLVPCLIAETAPWRFRIQCGQAIPEKLLEPRAGLKAAAQHLWHEFLPMLAQFPEQCGVEIFSAIHPRNQAPCAHASETIAA